MGQDFSNWSARTLCLLVSMLFGILVCARTVSRHLRRMGYRLIRPVPTIASPDPRYQEKLIQLEALKEQARRGEIILLFEDEIDIHLLPGVTRCWTKQGQQKKVPTPGKNQKRYGFGAVSYLSGALHFLVSAHKDSASFCALVRQILRACASDARRIVLVVDNFGIHSSQITQKELAVNKDRLSVFYLPSYSPHLNLIERVWKQVRHKVTHNHLFESIEAAVRAVHRYVYYLNWKPSAVLSIISSPQ